MFVLPRVSLSDLPLNLLCMYCLRSKAKIHIRILAYFTEFKFLLRYYLVSIFRTEMLKNKICIHLFSAISMAKSEGQPLTETANKSVELQFAISDFHSYSFRNYVSHKEPINVKTSKSFVKWLNNYTFWFMFRSPQILFLVTFSDEFTKILLNICLHFARWDGQDGKKWKEPHATKVTKIPKTKIWDERNISVI